MLEKYWDSPFPAKLLGGVFHFVGVTGFLPNPIYSQNGVFETNAVHNVVHDVTGLIFLTGAFSDASLLTIRVVAALYVVVAAAGFGFVRANDADCWLHAGLAVVFATLGGLLPHLEHRSPAHA